MNVAFVTLVDLMGTSGQNVYSRNVASALANRNDISLRLVYPGDSKRLPGDFVSACEDVTTLPRKSPRSFRWHASIQEVLYRQLNTIFNSKDIDLFLSTLRPSLLVPPYLSHRHSIPYRILIEGKISHEVANLSILPFNTILSDIVSIWNIRTAERCYAVNPDIKQWVRSLPFSEPAIELLPHGVDTPELLRQTEQPLTFPKSTRRHDFCLCYVGSFKQYHCLPPLIKAISRLRDSGLDIRLSLVGTGPELESIRKIVHEYNISRATTFHGFVDPAGVPNYIQAADACYGVIDPARSGSPMKVYEYLANSSPVIATECDELKFIENEHVGVLIEKPTPKTVANAIKQLSETSEPERSQMGQRAQDAGYEHGQTWAEFADQVTAE